MSWKLIDASKWDVELGIKVEVNGSTPLKETKSWEVSPAREAWCTPCFPFNRTTLAALGDNQPALLQTDLNGPSAALGVVQDPCYAPGVSLEASRLPSILENPTLEEEEEKEEELFVENVDDKEFVDAESGSESCFSFVSSVELPRDKSEW